MIHKHFIKPVYFLIICANTVHPHYRTITKLRVKAGGNWQKPFRYSYKWCFLLPIFLVEALSFQPTSLHTLEI